MIFTKNITRKCGFTGISITCSQGNTVKWYYYWDLSQTSVIVLFPAFVLQNAGNSNLQRHFLNIGKTNVGNTITGSNQKMPANISYTIKQKIYRHSNTKLTIAQRLSAGLFFKRSKGSIPDHNTTKIINVVHAWVPHGRHVDATWYLSPLRDTIISICSIFTSVTGCY